jgi:hypothetical protein
MQCIRYSETECTSDNKNPTYYLSKISHNPFHKIKFNNTSTKEIERIINSIRVKNSHRYNEITITKMLKVSAPYVSSPLNYICKSITSGTFPARSKYSIVKPIS